MFVPVQIALCNNAALAGADMLLICSALPPVSVSQKHQFLCKVVLGLLVWYSAGVSRTFCSYVMAFVKV